MTALALGKIDSANLNGGQKLGVKYFIVAMVLFAAQIVFGLLAGMQYLMPDFLYEVMDFSVNRMVHVNAMVVWMLFGFIGSVYWMLEEESGIPIVGLKLANLIFWIFTLAVAVVVAVYLLVQIGPGEHSSIWLINEGRVDLCHQRDRASVVQLIGLYVVRKRLVEVRLDVLRWVLSRKGFGRLGGRTSSTGAHPRLLHVES